MNTTDGAHPSTIAKAISWPISEVKALIAEEEARYHVTKKFFDDLEKYIYDNAQPTHQVDKDGHQVYIAYYKGPLGKKYYIKSQWNTYKNCYEFAKPKILNHIVQGHSTGDLTQIAGSVILEYIMEEGVMEYVQPILYTYDSFDFYVLDNKLHEVIKRLVECMTTKTIETIKEDFNFIIDIPLKVSIEIGANKNDLQTLKLGDI